MGLSLSPEMVAIFGFAVLFAKKILSISDAVTDVNLPILSEKFVDDFLEKNPSVRKGKTTKKESKNSRQHESRSAKK